MSDTVVGDATPRPDFLVTLRERAAARSRRLALPEATDGRVLDAVSIAVRDRLFEPVLLGPVDEVRRGLSERGVDPGAVELRDTGDDGLVRRTLDHVTERRSDRGDPEGRLNAMACDALMQGATLVATGEVAGMVAGCVRTTADVVRAALTGVGLAPGTSTLSSSFYMVFGPEHSAGPAVLTFTDAGVVPEPTSEQLAEIAHSAVVARRRIVGDEPRVAFLSYSTKGSAGGPHVERVRRALSTFAGLAPDVAADGEMQADAALVPAIAERKAPDSPVAGRANVLVFPDLGAANLSYKLVQYLGGAVALGPVLQGLSAPVNDLSRGASSGDVVAVGCITSLQAD
ncbi:MAG: phosphate acyltransferase [Gemmatimonadota bacterium]|nr:phosphate acyltransferase [Gemmatimonadota bacterium]